MRIPMVGERSAPARGSTPRSAGTGFTLVELLVVMAISAILAAAAIPGFNRFTTAARLSEASSALRSALELARSEAMARAARVGVCRSVAPNAAAPACSTAAAGGFPGGDWASGWVVYQKAAANPGDVFEAGDTVIHRQQPLAPAAEGSRVVIWAPANGALVYNWNGVRAAGPVGAFALDFGIATLSTRTALLSNQAVCLGVNMVGRIEQVRSVAGACA